jgi:hypothetical protein
VIENDLQNKCEKMINFKQMVEKSGNEGFIDALTDHPTWLIPAPNPLISPDPLSFSRASTPWCSKYLCNAREMAMSVDGRKIKKDLHKKFEKCEKNKQLEHCVPGRINLSKRERKKLLMHTNRILFFCYASTVQKCVAV